MGFIHRKRVKPGKNGRVNISRSRSIDLGKPGPLTVNSHGRVTVRILPGVSLRCGRKH